ncbi:hypothetical protein L6R52_11130 [Myxococcota bacterium]|nr:hypothetical protein [Myxococcota bacterium]
MMPSWNALSVSLALSLVPALAAASVPHSPHDEALRPETSGHIEFAHATLAGIELGVSAASERTGLSLSLVAKLEDGGAFEVPSLAIRDAGLSKLHLVVPAFTHARIELSEDGAVIDRLWLVEGGTKAERHAAGYAPRIDEPEAPAELGVGATLLLLGGAFGWLERRRRAV